MASKKIELENDFQKASPKLEAKYGSKTFEIVWTKLLISKIPKVAAPREQPKKIV